MDTLENSKVFKEIRQEQIYEIIKTRKSVTIDELVEELYASPATIRRDLVLLEKAGLVRRFRGGALLADTVASEIAQELRENENADKKIIIANLMDRFFTDNQSFFIDSSTTTRFLPQVLSKYSGLTFFTNSIRTANELVMKTDASVHLAGGKVVRNSHSTSGVLTVEFLRQYHVDIALIACRGISSLNGCTVINEEQAMIKQAMIRNAKMSFLLCDSTKFEKSYLVTFAQFSDFDYFITDKAPEGKLLKAIQQSGCKIIAYDTIRYKE